MKKLINILLIFAFGLYLAGCDSDDNEVLPFGITRSDLKFTASGGEGKVKLPWPLPVRPPIANGVLLPLKAIV